jgi:hypothetical protein
MNRQRVFLVTLMWFAFVSGCGEGERRATREEIIGTYRGDLPPGPANLVVNAHGTWEYYIERTDGQPKFHRAGRWSPSPVNGRGAQIDLFQFEFGFRTSERESEPPPAYSWGAYFARYGSAVWVCIDLDLPKTCLKKVDRESPEAN